MDADISMRIDRSRTRGLIRLIPVFLLAFSLPGLVGVAAAAEDGRESGTYPAYYGIYQVSPDHVVGIDRFASDSGETWMLMSDYRTGVVRRLFPVSPTEFEMGPSFSLRYPVRLKVRFVRDARGNVTGISLHPIDGTTAHAKRIALLEHAVTIHDGKVMLSGTLMVPATLGPHPAIILLHGSGPLTRYSFGPYPHFFASLGLAVLVYDKRGTGASTGIRVDASTTGTQGRIVQEYYPDGLADDALAAFRLLRERRDIDPARIGVWGSSEGGMLATYVASRNANVAFAINSSGFMGPFSETFLYQLGATLRASGIPPGQIDEALAFGRLWLDVSRTGEDYQRFLEEREKALRQKRPWVSSRDPPSLEQMRWDWTHVFSFDPLPALANVRCPVLGLWGQLDTYTDAREAERRMRTVLAKSGNKDFTLKIFPNADHPLTEMPSRARMAPGVFETLRAWIRRRVRGR